MMTVSLPKEPYDWRVNIYLMAGVIGYAVAILLGLTSLPSISTTLSWREFRLFQSHLGWLCHAHLCHAPLYHAPLCHAPVCLLSLGSQCFRWPRKHWLPW